MEELIGQYLFQYKKCPLPELGVLSIITNKAVTMHQQNKLAPPMPAVEFNPDKMSPGRFITFIAAQKKITENEAAQLLKEYCNSLHELKFHEEVKLEHAGRFYIDASGILIFKSENFPEEFLPVVDIYPVTHPNVTHNITVGDNETTNHVMTEYYSDKPVLKKDTWWIWAIILMIVAAVLLFYYISTHKPSDNFGNTQKVEIAPSEKTYHK